LLIHGKLEILKEIGIARKRTPEILSPVEFFTLTRYAADMLLMPMVICKKRAM